MNIFKLGLKQTLRNSIATILLIAMPLIYIYIGLSLIVKSLMGSGLDVLLLALLLLLLPIILVMYIVLLYRALISSNVKVYSENKLNIKNGLVFIGYLVITLMCISIIYFQVILIVLYGLGLMETIIELPIIATKIVALIVMIPLVFSVVLLFTSFYRSISNHTSIKMECIKLLSSEQLLKQLIKENWLPLLIISTLLGYQAFILVLAVSMSFIFTIMAPPALIYGVPLVGFSTYGFIRNLAFALWFIIQLSSSVAKATLSESGVD